MWLVCLQCVCVCFVQMGSLSMDGMASGFAADDDGSFAWNVSKNAGVFVGIYIVAICSFHFGGQIE